MHKILVLYEWKLFTIILMHCRSFSNSIEFWLNIKNWIECKREMTYSIRVFKVTWKKTKYQKTTYPNVHAYRLASNRERFERRPTLDWQVLYIRSKFDYPQKRCSSSRCLQLLMILVVYLQLNTQKKNWSNIMNTI